MYESCIDHTLSYMMNLYHSNASFHLRAPWDRTLPVNQKCPYLRKQLNFNKNTDYSNIGARLCVVGRGTPLCAVGSAQVELRNENIRTVCFQIGRQNKASDNQGCDATSCKICLEGIYFETISSISYHNSILHYSGFVVVFL